MSRDWTPFEHYMVEQQNIKEGRGDRWDFMRHLTFHPIGQEPYRVVEDAEIELRQQYPVFGKYLGNFLELFGKIANFENGLDFLKQKDSALANYIATGEGLEDEDYLVQWFKGRLDPCFYYSERNNELLLDAICREALEKGLCNWVITDPDCMQVRRQVGFEDRGIFQLMQLDAFGEERFGDPVVYQLAWAEIDIEDYSQKEIDGVLSCYGYESFKDLLAAAGTRNEAYGQLAEMLFEGEVADCYVQQFTSWDEGLREIEDRTGLKLDAHKETSLVSISEEEMDALAKRGERRLQKQIRDDVKDLDAQIKECATQVGGQRQVLGEKCEERAFEGNRENGSR